MCNSDNDQASSLIHGLVASCSVLDTSCYFAKKPVNNGICILVALNQQGVNQDYSKMHKLLTQPLCLLKGKYESAGFDTPN